MAFQLSLRAPADWTSIRSGEGPCVIWNDIPCKTPVIPAKAGSQPVHSMFAEVCGMDSRFRGNDCWLQAIEARE
jgi:hypothetical protein